MPRGCIICGENVDCSGEFPDYGGYGYDRGAGLIHETCDLKRQIENLQKKLNAAHVNIDDLTIFKVSEVMSRHWEQTGVTLTDEHGNMCIVDKSRVRWLHGADEIHAFFFPPCDPERQQ